MSSPRELLRLVREIDKRGEEAAGMEEISERDGNVTIYGVDKWGVKHGVDDDHHLPVWYIPNNMLTRKTRMKLSLLRLWNFITRRTGNETEK